MKTATGKPEALQPLTAGGRPVAAAVVSPTRRSRERGRTRRPGEFRRSWEAQPSSARALRDALTRHLAPRIDAATVQQIVLCADEAFINAVEHAAGSRIEVSASIRDGELVLTVTDGGRGFDPGRLDPEAVPDLLAEHGRGLFLIHHFMDDLEIVSGEHGTALRMRRRLYDLSSRFAVQALEVA